MSLNLIKMALVWLAAVVLMVGWVTPAFANSYYAYPPYNSLDQQPSSGGCSSYSWASGSYNYCVSASASNGQADVYAQDSNTAQVAAFAYFDHDTYAYGAPSVYESSGGYCCVYPSVQIDSTGDVGIISGGAESSINAEFFVYYSSCLGCYPSVTNLFTVIWDSYTQGNTIYSCSYCTYQSSVTNYAAGYYSNAGGVNALARDWGGNAVANFDYTAMCPCFYATVTNLGITG